MKTLTDIKRRIVPGVILECVENTYRPVLNGTRRTVGRVQGNGFFWVQDGADRRSWTPYPKASGVKIIDGQTFDLSLERADHHVRLRFVEG